MSDAAAALLKEANLPMAGKVEEEMQNVKTARADRMLVVKEGTLEFSEGSDVGVWAQDPTEAALMLAQDPTEAALMLAEDIFIACLRRNKVSSKV